MAITKEKKKELIDKYAHKLSSATNVVVVQYNAIDVVSMTEIRKNLSPLGGDVMIVRKNLFLRALSQIGYQSVGDGGFDGPVMILYSSIDEYGPLKVVNKSLKIIAKKSKDASLVFLGGWFDKEWKSGDYVTELANIPTKEELISKLVYLLNYPIQSFVATLDQVAKKGE